METVINLTRQMANEVAIDLEKLLTKHSSISRRQPQRKATIPRLYWNELDVPGRQLQAKALKNYKMYSSIVRTLLQGQPSHDIRRLDDSERIVNEVIECHGVTNITSTQEALRKALDAVGVQTELLASLYQPTTSPVVFVPDTNALLYNPSIEDWRFTQAAKFRIVLTPTVLSELDQLKVTYRTEDVRKKAESLITRIKGYRSRGRLTEGVTLVRDVSELFALSVEPDFDHTLPWLKPDNNDDQIIASLIEVMRSYPRSAVILITRDLNLQNKAEFARLPFCEPPSP
jgi:hypothetical protein